MTATVFAACGRALEVGLKVQTLSRDGYHGYIHPGKVIGKVVSFGPGFVRIKSGTKVSTRVPHRVVVAA